MNDFSPTMTELNQDIIESWWKEASKHPTAPATKEDLKRNLDYIESLIWHVDARVQARATPKHLILLAIGFVIGCWLV